MKEQVRPVSGQRLTARGYELDQSADCFGELRSSAEVVDDTAVLRQRMHEDGYLFLPGFLDVDAVFAARRSVTERLLTEGLIDPEHPTDAAVAHPDSRLSVKPDLAHDNEALHELLYRGRMIAFYERFLGGDVRHYDYTWMRVVSPGLGTAPHADVVFMGRGSHNLYTAWVPLGDADLELGGLMVLEGSHRRPEIRDDYARRDVDTYCSNVDGEQEHALNDSGQHGWHWNGSLTDNPVELQRRLGGRWLTSEFRAGDLLTFNVYMAHASLDNSSNRLRLSSDSRYQLASDPIDERWIGEAPIAHGPNAKRGLIC